MQPSISLELWIIIAGIIAVAALGALRALSALINYECALQDVALAADKLRKEYDRRVKEMLEDADVTDEGAVSLEAAQEAMERAKKAA
ncbi:MAG: hypothetical protein AB7G17_02480 [Phycisphaerales bacterium]